MAGTATSRMRVPEATSDGTVFPIAWNMLDATKTKPDAMKFHDAMRRYSVPTASTAGSFENTPIKAWGALRQMTTSSTMTAETMYAALRNVSMTRSRLRAPKFCPATGATEKPSATAGMNKA